MQDWVLVCVCDPWKYFRFAKVVKTAFGDYTARDMVLDILAPTRKEASRETARLPQAREVRKTRIRSGKLELAGTMTSLA